MKRLDVSIAKNDICWLALLIRANNHEPVCTLHQPYVKYIYTRAYAAMGLGICGCTEAGCICKQGHLHSTCVYECKFVCICMNMHKDVKVKYSRDETFEIRRLFSHEGDSKEFFFLHFSTNPSQQEHQEIRVRNVPRIKLILSQS